MTREIVIHNTEYEKIIKTIKEIEGISSLNPETLEDAELNLDTIKDLAFKLHGMMRVRNHSY